VTTTNSASAAPDLSDPIWTVEHIAHCFHIEVDTTREYTARDDFPAPRRLSPGGGRFLWPREDVLAWFHQLPTVSAGSRKRRGGTAARPSTAAIGNATATTKTASHTTYRRQSSTVARSGRAA
jgi:predicted DNA-binding transcriptional regulator AlpA